MDELCSYQVVHMHDRAWLRVHECWTVRNSGTVFLFGGSLPSCKNEHVLPIENPVQLLGRSLQEIQRSGSQWLLLGVEAMKPLFLLGM